jgi:hypothetical protein
MMCAWGITENGDRARLHLPSKGMVDDPQKMLSELARLGARLPLVTTAGRTVQVSVTASDSGTGVSSYSWSLGDGAQNTTSAPYERYSYLQDGTYFGQVTVTDRAGNQASSPFTAVIATSTPGLPPPSTPGPPAPPAHPQVAPRITVQAAQGYAAYMLLHRGRTHSRTKMTCTRSSQTVLRCKVAWAANGSTYKAAGKFWDYLGSGHAYWRYDFAGTRTSLSCLKKHRRSARCSTRFRWR